jgi:hypothetical protein
MDPVSADWDDSYILDVFTAAVNSHGKCGADGIARITEAERRMRQQIEEANAMYGDRPAAPATPAAPAASAVSSDSSFHSSHAPSYGHNGHADAHDVAAAPFIGEVVDLGFGRPVTTASGAAAGSGVAGTAGTSGTSANADATGEATGGATAPCATATATASANNAYSSGAVHAAMMATHPTQEAMATMLRSW